MSLAEGEKYGGTMKLKNGRFRRAVVGPRGTVRRWELFDGEGNEVPRAKPVSVSETVSQPKGDEMGKPAEDKAQKPETGKPEGAGEAKGGGWKVWVLVGGALVIAAGVGAALWTRRKGTGQPAAGSSRLRAVG